MPHFSFEYSSNLDGRLDVDAFCDRMLDAILSTGLFEVGAVRVRAIRAAHYAIADRNAENAFVDMTFRIGCGRSADEKKAAGETIFAAATDVLAALFARPHFALSLEIREIDADLSWKKNAMHARLRASAG